MAAGLRNASLLNDHSRSLISSYDGMQLSQWMFLQLIRNSVDYTDQSLGSMYFVFFSHQKMSTDFGF